VSSVSGGGAAAMGDHLLVFSRYLSTRVTLYEGTMLFVSRDRHFLAAFSNRVPELTPPGVCQYGGGYTEYVARTGQEARGLHA